MNSKQHLSLLRTALLTNSSLSARQLRTPLALSQPSLSRLLGKFGPELAIIGRGPRTRYGLLRNVRGLGTHWPIYRISEQGEADQLGELHALNQGAFWLNGGSSIDWLTAEFQDGVFPDFPWFLSDLRPQGFLGRALARKVAPIFMCDADPRTWSADLCLHALLAFGSDLSGDLVLGAAALEAAQNFVPQVQTSDAFPALAERALSGELIGSSAAGEQPKFSCWLRNAAGEIGAYQIKFSPPMTTDAGRRWGDLLVAEAIADRLLGGTGDTIEVGNRRFLVSPRFDRFGTHGRRGLVSIGAVDTAYFGGLDDWVSCASRFEQAGWLSHADAETLRLRYFFGRAIGNTDMHFGNASLIFSTELPMVLAPSYDMLPMIYAPLANGEVLKRTFTPPVLSNDPLQRKAYVLAKQFWALVAQDSRISTVFAQIAKALA
jgi:HipA-like C-terminal domain